MIRHIDQSHSTERSMKTRKTPVISARKRPRQERSERLVAYILEAAVRVLAREGAQRFTTARVAEEAGVSVGSLYQYFPNKEAILFRLQSDEWDQTAALLESILVRSDEPALDRLRSMVRAFFQSEREEASLRTALKDAAPLYRGAPEVRKHREIGMRRLLTFMHEALPEVPAKERAFAAAFVMTTMSAVGKSVSVEARSKAEVDTWAVAMGDMLWAYLEQLAESY
jgi:AcrR family transcriptional regulator